MIRMLSRTAAPLATLLLLAGCGSAEDSLRTENDSGTTKVGTTKVGECRADSPAVVNARTVAAADLDGDGKGSPVELTEADGDCANTLFAKVGNRYLAAQLPPDGPPLSSAFGIEVPGHDGQLLVTRQDHPRGGFQLRVYAAGDSALTELKVDGHALVPFVALDVEEHPLSVDCTDGGVVVTEAVPHEPTGVAFAWDVKRTTYAIDGTEVSVESSVEIADNVLPGQLAAKYPDLVKHTAFKSCRAAD
jgi:hypothetical protein